MFKKSLLFLFVCLILSCQQEDSITLNPTDLPELQSVQLEKHSYMDDLDQSIVKSTWWQSLHPTSQQFIGLELSNESDPITFTELQNRMQSVRKNNAFKAKVCPGFPANPEGDVTLNSQADVDAFGAMKCKEIVGALNVIDTMGLDPICDLTPLKGIKEVGSSMTINSDCLTDLSGLEKLKSIGELGPFGFVGVNGANLTDIEALRKLSVVTGSVNIIDCDELTSVTEAFSRITTIESGKFANPLTSVFVLNINDNELLRDLSAFSGMEYIEGGLRILSNASILDLDDLSGLNSVGDDIFIVENAALQNVNELSNISTISDDLFVFNNTSLSECCGLYNLLSPGGVGGGTAIFNNGAGCTELDILANGPCP